MINIAALPSETDPPELPCKATNIGAPLGNQHNLRWLPEHDEALKKLRADGYSSSQSAVIINNEFNTRYSRNAVIGRCHRLGLTDQRVKSIPKKVVRLREPRPESRARIRLVPPRSEPEVTRLRCAEIVPLHIGILALDETTCRYPYGGDQNSSNETFTFCGHPPTAGSSYCMPHFQICLGGGTPSERAAHRGVVE